MTNTDYTRGHADRLGEAVDRLVGKDPPAGQTAKVSRIVTTSPTSIPSASRTDAFTGTM